MYREILTSYQNELADEHLRKLEEAKEALKIDFTCPACHIEHSRLPYCELTQNKVGDGFMHICGYRGCRGLLVLTEKFLTEVA